MYNVLSIEFIKNWTVKKIIQRPAREYDKIEISKT